MQGCLRCFLIMQKWSWQSRMSFPNENWMATQHTSLFTKPRVEREFKSGRDVTLRLGVAHCKIYGYSIYWLKTIERACDAEPERMLSLITFSCFRACLTLSETCQHVCLEAGRQAILAPCQESILHLAVRAEHTNPSGPALFILF